jgi:hypothetical protein
MKEIMHAKKDGIKKNRTQYLLAEPDDCSTIGDSKKKKPGKGDEKKTKKGLGSKSVAKGKKTVQQTVGTREKKEVAKKQGGKKGKTAIAKEVAPIPIVAVSPATCSD